MKIGAHLANGGVWASPDTIIPLGVRAEELGYDSLWVSDHVVVPSKIDESKYPYGPPGTFNPDASQNYFEAFATLAFLAGRTRRVQLGTSVIVLPQRQPLLVAKQWATLDALSGGRTILGVGAGWMREEFEALGMDTFERRGPATDEAIKLYRRVWTQQGDISFEGDVYRFSPLRALPKPAQSGGIPIWIGGHGRRSIRRAAELGDGWQPVRMNLADLRASVATLREMVTRYGRQPGDVTISAVVSAYAPGAGPSGTVQDCDLVGGPEEMAEKLRAYQSAGVEHIAINTFPRDSVTPMLEALEYVAREVRPLLGR
jgi:probable F420-dependent oxidoreductase